LEEVLGIQRRGEQLRIAPVIPAEWPEFQVRYRFGNTTYEIHVDNPDHVVSGIAAIELDGQPLAEPLIALIDDGNPHVVRVRLGSKKPAGEEDHGAVPSREDRAA
jgi:cellobiose phosphorylase